ncbi:MAG: hypothetical protein KBD78_00280, partial [Oligoflexales bacterium]|nr:hypothetical protein [Oligoflexales bacterium]
LQTLSSCLPIEPLGNLDHSALEAKSNSMPAEAAGPQLYTREEETEIGPDPSLYNGSLIGVDQQQANFLVQNKSLGIGSYIDIIVVAKEMQKTAAQLGAKKDAKNADPEAATNESADTESSSSTTASAESANAGGTKSGSAANDASQDELAKMLEGLPELVQEDAEIVPIKTFRAKVVAKKANGDVVLEYERSSLQTAEQKGVLIRAVLAEKYTLNPDDFTTERLQDIKWQEFENGLVTARESPEWQNEYTLRLSGFDEAKSLAAMDLEKKRQQVIGLRDGVKNQINNIRKEKQTFAKERETLLKKQAEQEKLIAELNTKVAEAEAKEEPETQAATTQDSSVQDSSAQASAAQDKSVKNTKGNAEAKNAK